MHPVGHEQSWLEWPTGFASSAEDGRTGDGSRIVKNFGVTHIVERHFVANASAKKSPTSAIASGGAASL